MKNKFIIFLVIAMSVFALAACGSGSDESTTAASGGSSSSDGYAFTYQGTKIEMGMDASVIDSLGEYKNYSESTTCAYKGLDKQYFYGSFYITTGSRDDDNTDEFVANMWFVDDTVETDEGLCIGDSKDKIEEIYGGDGLDASGAYIFEKGDSKLTILVSDDTVSSIQYDYTGK